MRARCRVCGLGFNDATRSTVCPHGLLPPQVPVTTQQGEVGEGGQPEPDAASVGAGERRRLPGNRIGLTARKQAAGYKFYVTVNFYDDSALPGEVFVNIAKEGSDVAGFVNAWAITLSVALQYGVPWERLRDKYLWSRFGINASDDCPSIVHAMAETVTELIAMREGQLGCQSSE